MNSTAMTVLAGFILPVAGAFAASGFVSRGGHATAGSSHDFGHRPLEEPLASELLRHFRNVRSFVPADPDGELPPGGRMYLGDLDVPESPAPRRGCARSAHRSRLARTRASSPRSRHCPSERRARPCGTRLVNELPRPGAPCARCFGSDSRFTSVARFPRDNAWAISPLEGSVCAVSRNSIAPAHGSNRAAAGTCVGSPASSSSRSPAARWRQVPIGISAMRLRR